MANKFQILIEVADRATAGLRKINQSVDKLLKPFERFRQSAKIFGRELGLDDLGKALMHAGHAAGELGEKFKRVAEPLMAITGIGGLATATEVIKSFADASERLTNTAAAIGAPVRQLQQLEGAARLAGVGTETLDTGLQSLGRTLQDASAGRNVEAFFMMERIGLRLHRMKGGAVDTVRALKDLSAYLSSPKLTGRPQVQELVAAHFGVEQLMPLLRRGPQAIDQMMAAADNASGVTEQATERGARFAETLHRVSESALGLRSAIGDKLIPAVSPLLEQLGGWIEKNRELIANNVGQMASSLATALTQVNWTKIAKDIEGIASGILKVVNAIGGWGNAMIGLVAVMNLGSLWRLGKAALWVGEAFSGVALRGVTLLAAGLANIPGAAASAGAALTGLRASAIAAGAASNAALLGAAGKVALAGAGGWLLGTGINWLAGKGLTKALGHDASIGTALYDMLHPEAASQQSALGPSGASGAVKSPIRSSTATTPALPAPAAAPSQPFRIELYIPNGSRDTRVRTTAPDNVDVDLHVGYAMPTP